MEWEPSWLVCSVEILAAKTDERKKVRKICSYQNMILKKESNVSSHGQEPEQPKRGVGSESINLFFKIKMEVFILLSDTFKLPVAQHYNCTIIVI